MSFERKGAFDQATRGRLQKLVNSGRGLLSEEFSIQLQQTYGLDPKTGEVTPMARLTHLDDRQRHTAEVLRLTLAHYLGADEDDTDHRIAVLDRMVREQAFTVLNRLAALLMMEARGQLIESVSKGYQSRGYQLYSKIAGTALGETGQAYQVYLFSVFDELAQELPALFDRYAANGLLFPRETALRALLDELNHFEIEPLWAADETIGWIYQYFNSKEERKAMRDASQAPRNSRELAVRNQFFTPRYVVEFLVDNTLGRLWFNTTGGQTDLRDRCQYLLVKPDEQPQASSKVRDPRTLKLLDPACGSMHFGLYAFDLFAEIYREAWVWEQQHGPGSLDVSTQPQAALKPLSHTYDDEAAFARDVPRLIIENNIYGVDIDPRAAQIATLALWLRAQRAWHDASVKAKDRPRIGQGHVMAAVAPPAERELRLQFTANLDRLDAELFEKTLQLLKGLPEMGVLLQVERELPHLIEKVYGKNTDLFNDGKKAKTWAQIESDLRAALAEFSQATKSTYQGRLFSQDALQGLRLIDLCREVFDVVVMNPPFGALASGTKGQLTKAYPRSKNDLLAIMVERGIELLRDGGRIGAITSRACFYLSSFQPWRDGVVLGMAPPVVMADLGYGVMDDAMVEAAAYVLEKSS
ncbi:SAM-dependent methyltransferase [Alcaligenaceae bacterium]|nr:SAM-dependent methyltransferase [Alcaligenaceae bacterium]